MSAIDTPVEPTGVDVLFYPPHLSCMPQTEKNDIELLRTWTLPTAATMGSAIRAKGIVQEIRARLPSPSKKALVLDGCEMTLALPSSAKAAFHAAVAIVTRALAEAEALPVIPREIQDILSITATERHRWLADGRLSSAGTRTVRLAGRARKITFHVFDPKVVEDLLDRGVVDEWRVEDAEAKAEKRRWTAHQSKPARDPKKRAGESKKAASPDEYDTDLRGWEEFISDGILR